MLDNHFYLFTVWELIIGGRLVRYELNLVAMRITWGQLGVLCTSHTHCGSEVAHAVAWACCLSYTGNSC